MLSASGTKKNSSDEDSSGSEAKVCPEPVTDRFGFLLTNGASAQGLGPHPHLVREREGKWINIINQWEAILMKKSNKVKVQCQKGIPSSLRAKCWPLLCGAMERMKPAKHVYKSLDSGAALQHWVDVIERDLDRQFPFHEMFQSKDGHGQHGLFRVLKAYTQFQPDEGYCQAQGPVAAVLLMNMPEEEAFWCLVQISEQYLPGYYSPLLEGVLFDAALLTWLIKRTCPPAYKHLQRHGVEPLMFATDWLMCLFTRHLPFNTLLRVWDLFFCYGVRVLLQVAVVLVRHVLGQAEQRKQCQGQMETLERLRAVKEEVKVEEDTFIAEVCSVPLSTSDLEKQTVKELEKWQKDRPSSTFDPRGRCQGYRMAWAHIIDHKEEQDRKKRETGNLSVTLIRSASTLSLSPSILERWRGGKGSAKEGESRRKIIRHFSMGAKDEWGTWRNLTFKKVQSVLEEDVVIDEHQEQKEKKHQSVPVKNRAEYKYQRGKSQEVEPQLIVNVAHKTSDDNSSEPATGDVQEGSEKKEAGSEPTTHETEEQMIAHLKAESDITPEEGEEPRRGNEDKTETDLTVEIEGRSSETGAPDAQLHNRDSVEIESHPQTDLQAETREKVGENAAVQDEPALGTVSRPERAEEHDVVIKAGEVINGSEIHQRECDEEIITPGHQEMNEDDADRAESVSPELLEIHMEQTEDPSEPDDQRRDIQTIKAEEDDGKDSRRSSSSGSTGDVCVQKSFTCAAPEEARRLDEELIKPQGKQSGQSVEITGSNPARTPPDTSSVKHKEAARTSSPQVLSNKSVFHRLKGEKAKRKQKLIIPKITVQDFSDPHVQQDDEKLSSRERRRKKNKESETRRQEEKKARKKETRKQKKKSSQLQKEDESKEAVPLGKTGSQSLKHSASYAELYF